MGMFDRLFSKQGRASSTSLVLTRSNSRAEGQGELVAPGYPRQRYTLFGIDTRDFSTGGASSTSLVLTRSNSRAEGQGELVAPGYPRQRYTLFGIDTRDFSTGGTLEIDVTVGE